MTSKINWKSTEILKVFGTTIRQGVFTGGKATEDGVITKDSPTNFTPSYIAMLYENVNSHIPFYLDHQVGSRTPIGYAFKFGVSDMLDDIKYNGFVFDQAAKQKIMLEGYDSVSPEIDESYDENGKLVSARIKGIAFTRAPAISGLEMSAEPIVFSKPDPNTTDMTETPVETTPVVEQPVEKPVVQDVAPVVKPAPKAEPVPQSSNPEVAALAAQLNEYKTRLEQSESAKEELLNVQFNGVSGELKSLGVEDPGSIVRGLPMEQKIAVLSKMKDTVIKTRPMSAPTASTTPAESAANNDSKVNAALAELGIKPDYYRKLTGA